MYTVIRTYTGAPSFATELKRHSAEVESVISGVPGFIAYYFIATNDGGVSVTVCEQRAGCDESTRLASEWLRKNLPNLKLKAPQVVSGEMSFKFARYPAKV